MSKKKAVPQVTNFARPFDWHTTSVGDMGWTKLKGYWYKGAVESLGQKYVNFHIIETDKFVRVRYEDVFTAPKVD